MATAGPRPARITRVPAAPATSGRARKSGVGRL